MINARLALNGGPIVTGEVPCGLFGYENTPGFGLFWASPFATRQVVGTLNLNVGLAYWLHHYDICTKGSSGNALSGLQPSL